MMVLLLQLHGDLPEYFSSHERRLYVFVCRRRTCRRRDGSIRAIRGIRVSPVPEKTKKLRSGTERGESDGKHSSPSQDLGDSLFGTKSCYSSVEKSKSVSTSSAGNPNPNPNPFSIGSPAASLGITDKSSSPFGPPASKPSQPPAAEDLHMTFAQKACVASPPPTQLHLPEEHWPKETELPLAYPSYYLDADYETLDVPSNSSVPTRAMGIDEAGGTLPSSGGGKDDVDTFESTIDKDFQRFADRLAQNPLQVLRYEFRGAPLLYSKTDAVGKLLAAQHSSVFWGNSKVTTAGRARDSAFSNCPNCSAERVFELQLTPQAISELEVDETGLEGMEWGTVILGVCSEDCQAKGVEIGKVGHLEEWIGVQWEEIGVARR